MAEMPSDIQDQTEIEKRAVALSDQAVEDSQGHGQIKSLAKIQRGSPIFKIWTSFYSAFSANMNNNYEAFSKTNFRKPRDVGRLAVDLFFLNLLPCTLSTLLMTMVRGGDLPEEPEDLAKELAMANVNYAFGNFIFLRELSSAMSGFSGYEGPAGTRFFSEVGGLTKEISQGELDQGLARKANKVGGILFHYPAGQLDKTVRGTKAIIEGETANPGAIVFGPPPKN
jgi:hypothetical protein